MSTFMEQWALLLAPNRKISAGVKLDPLVEGRNPFLATIFHVPMFSTLRGPPHRRPVALVRSERDRLAVWSFQ